MLLTTRKSPISRLLGLFFERCKAYCKGFFQIILKRGLPSALALLLALSVFVVPSFADAADVESLKFGELDGKTLDYSDYSDDSNPSFYNLLFSKLLASGSGDLENRQLDVETTLGDKQVTLTGTAHTNFTFTHVNIKPKAEGGFPPIFALKVPSNKNSYEAWTAKDSFGGHYDATLRAAVLPISLDGLSGDVTIEPVQPKVTVTLPRNVEGAASILFEGEESGSSKSVDKGSEVSFVVTAQDGYEPSAVEAVGADNVAKHLDGVQQQDKLRQTKYTITGVDSNTRVSVTMKAKKYTVTVNGYDPEKMFSATLGGSQSVIIPEQNYNATYTFELEAKAGYADPEVQYTMGETKDQTVPGYNGKYSVGPITDNVTISIKAGGTLSYTFTAPTGSAGVGYTAKAKQGEDTIPNGTGTVSYGKKVTYSVKVEDNFSKSVPTLSISGQEPDVSGAKAKDSNTYTWTWNSLTRNTTVNAVNNVERDAYHITLPHSGAGYSVTGNENYSAGRSYSFTITVDEGYEVTAQAPGYSCLIMIEPGESADVSVTKDGNRYTVSLSGVKSDLTITIPKGAIKQQTFTVEAPTNKGDGGFDFAFTGGGSEDKENVAWGTQVSFTVTPKDGYTVSNVGYIAGEGSEQTLTGSPIAQGNGRTYTVTVTAETTIVVHASKNSYPVTFPTPTTGFTVTVTPKNGEAIASGASVEHNTVITIKVAVNEAYKGKPNVEVNGEKQTMAEGQDYTYTCTVVGATNITVDGISAKRFTVMPPTFNEQESGGYTLSGVTSATTVGWEGEVQVTVTLTAGYKLPEGGWDSVLTVEETGKATVSATNEGTTSCEFTVSEIKGNINLKVSGIKAITPNVSYNNGDRGFRLQLNSQAQTSVNVKYGSNVFYTVTAVVGYRITKISYTRGDGQPNVVQVSAAGQYSIPDVNEDVKITVTAEKIRVTVVTKVLNYKLYGVDFGGSTATAHYSIGESDSKLSVSEDETKLMLAKPDDLNKAGLVFNGWTLDGITAQDSYEVTDQLTYTFVGTFSAKEHTTGEDDTNAPFFKSTKTTLNTTKTGNEKRVQNMWQSTLSSDLQGNDLEALKGASGVKVLAYGALYSDEEIKVSDVADFLANTARATAAWTKCNDNKHLYYVYYDNNDEYPLQIGEKVSFKMVCGQGLQRYGCVFFIVEIDGRRYTVFGRVRMSNSNVGD